MANLSNFITTIDPAVALIGGVALGVCATLVFLQWSHAPRRKADPLSGLFEGDTLDDQLARISDPKARRERKDRQASAIRAKIFAHKAAKRAQMPHYVQPETAPHRAERFEHAAVLNHIAKVMRADMETENAAIQPDDTSGQWEEVLLLPAPLKTQTTSRKPPETSLARAKPSVPPIGHSQA